MGRPQLALGTHGRVRTCRHGDGWRAMTLIRDFDGRTRAVQRHVKTRGGAEQALARALQERSGFTDGGDVTPNTKVSVLAELGMPACRGRTEVRPRSMHTAVSSTDSSCR